MIPSPTPVRHLVGSRRGGMLTAVTLLLGAGTAWAVAGSRPAFGDVLEPVQLAVSVLVPFFGVLAVTDLHRPRSADRRLAPRLLIAVGLAVGFSLAATLLAAGATVWADGLWPGAPRTAALVTAAILVQVIAQLTGTGWGLLIRRPVIAMAATILAPMATTALLGVVDPGGGLVRWLTPYGNARSLLAGIPTPETFAGLVVVTLLWCAIPNLLGARTKLRTPR
jgi:hypothetical protein